MYRIEFFKIVQRKFNYIYFVTVLCLLFFCILKDNVILKFLDISKGVYIYEYLLKYMLIFIILLNLINIILSYREDYTSKARNIIINSSKSNFSNIFSKLLINFIVFFVYYLLFYSFVIAYYIYKKDISLSDFYSINSIYYLLIVGSLLLLVNSLVLFFVSIFNNTNLAISFSVLFLIGSKFLTNYLQNTFVFFDNLKYTFFDVINNVFLGLVENIAFNYLVENLIVLLANFLIIFLITVLINGLKTK